MWKTSTFCSAAGATKAAAKPAASQDLTHPTARAQRHPGPKRERPVSDIGAGLCALRAAARAVADIDACGAALIFRGRHCGIGWPPVRPEPIQRAAINRSGLAERYRRHRRIARRHAGVACQAGHVHLHEFPVRAIPGIRDPALPPLSEGGTVQHAYRASSRTPASAALFSVTDGAPSDWVRGRWFGRSVEGCVGGQISGRW